MSDQDAVLREMYERSRDTIRIYNPLTIDFRFKWDSVWNTVKAKKSKDVERYLAKKYYDDISKYIIGQMALEKGTAMLNERKERGLNEFLNKYDENRAIWDNTPRLDNKELLEKIAEEVILGLVSKFGSEEGPEDVAPQEDRTIPLTDQIMDSVSKKKATDELPEAPIIKPFKKKLDAKEVTDES